MNIVCLDKQFRILLRKESAVKFLFEPQMAKRNPSWRRHIYFNELKFDFMNEISAYGFSPFIHQTFDSQRRNKDIMKYQSQKFNYSLVEYIRKQNIKDSANSAYTRQHQRHHLNPQKVKDVDSSDVAHLSNKSTFIKSSSGLKNGLNSSGCLPQQDFLSNALKKIAHSTPKNSKASPLLNNSSESNDANTSTERRVAAQKKKESQVKNMDHLRKRYEKSLQQFRNVHPVVSMELDNTKNRKDFTLLRKYNPQFNKTLNPVALLRRKEDPSVFAQREKDKKGNGNRNKANSIIKLQPSADLIGINRQSIAKSAHRYIDQSDLLHRARRSSEVIFHYY